MKNNSQMLNENERFLIISKTFDSLKDLIRAIMYVGIVYWIYRSIETLAGKNTEASFLLGYFTSRENDYGLPWVVAVISLMYGFMERRLRLRKTEYLQKRVLELEKRIDPSRQGSHLLPTGETNPKDEI